VARVRGKVVVREMINRRAGKIRDRERTRERERERETGGKSERQKAGERAGRKKITRARVVNVCLRKTP